MWNHGIHTLKRYRAIHTKAFAPCMQPPFFMIDARDEIDPDQFALQWMQDDLAKPIHLEHDALFKQVLFKLENDRYYWYQKIHHIAADAFGFFLISRRIAHTYTALVQ